MTKPQWHSLKLWTKTYRKLKRIAAETGETLAQVGERLAEDEEVNIQVRKLRAERQAIGTEE